MAQMWRRYGGGVALVRSIGVAQVFASLHAGVALESLRRSSKDLLLPYQVRHRRRKFERININSKIVKSST